MGFYCVLAVYCSEKLCLVIADIVSISWKLRGCRLCLMLFFVVKIESFGNFCFSKQICFSLVKAVIFIAFFEMRIYRK